MNTSMRSSIITIFLCTVLTLDALASPGNSPRLSPLGTSVDDGVIVHHDLEPNEVAKTHFQINNVPKDRQGTDPILLVGSPYEPGEDGATKLDLKGGNILGASKSVDTSILGDTDSLKFFDDEPLVEEQMCTGGFMQVKKVIDGNAFGHCVEDDLKCVPKNGRRRTNVRRRSYSCFRQGQTIRVPFEETICTWDKCRGTDGGTVRPGHEDSITCSKVCTGSVYSQMFKTRPDGTPNPTEGSAHDDPTNDSKYHSAWCRFMKYSNCKKTSEVAKSCTAAKKAICLAITPRKKSSGTWNGQLTEAMVDECNHFPNACDMLLQKE